MSNKYFIFFTYPLPILSTQNPSTLLIKMQMFRLKRDSGCVNPQTCFSERHTTAFQPQLILD